MGKNSDKLYITNREWTAEFGGKKESTPGTAAFRRLPFHSCALSLQPFEHPVCTKQGVLYDLERIVPWLKEHGGVDPVSGEPLAVSELVPLHFHKNHQGEYHCPVTFKVFTDNTHIVAIKPSGNVYAWEAVDRLNIKTKHWKDLLTDVPFKRADIITLQDPERLELRNIAGFHHVKGQGRQVESGEKKKKETTQKGPMASRILSELEETMPTPPSLSKKQSQEPDVDPERAEHLAHFSKGKASASFTSTSMPIVTRNEPDRIDPDQYMYKHITKKGYVHLKTSLGTLHLELYCPTTPKTCHNFLRLAQRGYYNGTSFHRLIPNFMIQGGDPSGTGRGGASSFTDGKPFQDELRTQYSHNDRGILSMANKGKHTNTSQFFLTFRPCEHLDGKHTIFGRVVGGVEVLDRMEGVPCDAKDRPKEAITILEVVVLVDPFQEYVDQERADVAKAKKRAVGEVESAAAKEPALKLVATKEGVGRYMASSSSSSAGGRSTAADVEPPRKQAKPAPRKELKDFSSWS